MNLKIFIANMKPRLNLVSLEKIMAVMRMLLCKDGNSIRIADVYLVSRTKRYCNVI